MVLVAAIEFWLCSNCLILVLGNSEYLLPFKKKLAHTSVVVERTALVRHMLYVPIFAISAHYEPFFNAVSEELQWYVIFFIAVIQPRWYL